MSPDSKVPVLQGTPTKPIPHIYFIYIDKIHVQIPTSPHVYPTRLPHTLSASLNPSPIHRNIRVTRVNDLIPVVTLHATVMTSSSLTYLVGCGIASNDSYQVRYL